MQKQSIVIEPHKSIKEFRLYLLERENAPATIDKYLTDINTFCRFLNHNYEISKQRVLEYKDVAAEHYAVSSANSMLAALSQFLEFLGVSSMKVKRIKVQKQMILQEEQLLSEEEYHTLIKLHIKRSKRVWHDHGNDRSNRHSYQRTEIFYSTCSEARQYHHS